MTNIIQKEHTILAENFLNVIIIICCLASEQSKQAQSLFMSH